MFLSKTRAVWSATVSIVFVFLAMNLIERNEAILQTRSSGRVVLDYVLNILLFFALIYLIATFISWLYNKMAKKN